MARRNARSRPAFSACGLALALATQACGGSARAPASPASAPAAETREASPAGEDTSAYPQASPAAPPSGAAAPAAPMAAPTEAAAAPAASEAIPTTMTAEVRAEMKKAERAVATGDCPTACRALGSMEHAVAFLCAANSSAEDADRCAVARRHVQSARRRIRTTCGGCPGGPSVDPDAPIPSTR